MYDTYLFLSTPDAYTKNYFVELQFIHFHTYIIYKPRLLYKKIFNNYSEFCGN
jgi:hypothetical protein